MTDMSRVILIDDDAEVLEASRQTLELDGFAVDAAGSAKAGLSRLTHDAPVSWCRTSACPVRMASRFWKRFGRWMAKSPSFS